MKIGKCYECGNNNVELCLNRKCKACMTKYKRDWYLRNKKSVQDKQGEYREANKTRLRVADKKWRVANREKDAARVANWAKNNPGRRAESQRRRRARKLGTQVAAITQLELEARLAVFGGVCAYCGGPFEHWDHFKPLELGGPHILSNMRPSCASCNIRKGHIHPYQWMLMCRPEDPQQLIWRA